MWNYEKIRTAFYKKKILRKPVKFPFVRKQFETLLKIFLFLTLHSQKFRSSFSQIWFVPLPSILLEFHRKFTKMWVVTKNFTPYLFINRNSTVLSFSFIFHFLTIFSNYFKKFPWRSLLLCFLKLYSLNYYYFITIIKISTQFSYLRNFTKWANENKDAERLGLRIHVGTRSNSDPEFNATV